MNFRELEKQQNDTELPSIEFHLSQLDWARAARIRAMIDWVESSFKDLLRFTKYQDKKYSEAEQEFLAKLTLSSIKRVMQNIKEFDLPETSKIYTILQSDFEQVLNEIKRVRGLISEAIADIKRAEGLNRNEMTEIKSEAAEDVIDDLNQLLSDYKGVDVTDLENFLIKLKIQLSYYSMIDLDSSKLRQVGEIINAFLTSKAGEIVESQGGDSKQLKPLYKSILRKVSLSVSSSSAKTSA